MLTFDQMIKDTTWQNWCERQLVRVDTLTGEEIIIEPGVAYFVDALERLGAEVKFSCEGHPKGFYVLFRASYDTALQVSSAGYFTVELTKGGRWRLSLIGNEQGIESDGNHFTIVDKNNILGCAAAVWEHNFFD